MADLLIRNLAEHDKEALKARASKNGRSQQAEAKAILLKGLHSGQRDWVSLLRGAASFEEGEFVAPPRHAARKTDVEGWL